MQDKKVRAIILGSGISMLEDIEPYESIKYSEIEGFPPTTVKGHKGVLEKYKVEDIVSKRGKPLAEGFSEIWLMKGRLHLYEGNSWEQAALPVRYLLEQSVQDIVLSNAAGGLDPSLRVGDLMQIVGYLDLMRPGQDNLKQILKTPLKFETEILQGVAKQGVYAGFHGPTYETDAEVRLLRAMGAHAVGMSTVPEIETAVQAGAKLLAISVITNVYAVAEVTEHREGEHNNAADELQGSELAHDEVLRAAKSASKRFEEIILGV